MVLVAEAGAAPGTYTLLRHVATGGMAEIHLALTHGIEGFEKLVIVKRILPHLARDADFVQMFLNEARVAATLQHPNVVQVYDIGRDDSSHFFTMEFVYGADLSNILRRASEVRRPPTLDQALTIVLGLCAGLHYAHEKEGLDGRPLGMVHRDVSPQNVLVSFDGATKLVDFGIAKAATRAGVTRDGALKGKIAYMSPEQCRSRPLDRRSDVFSLAILLWELTTFRRLFRADSDYDQLEMITSTDAPPPSKFRVDYPPALEKIVMKGLRRDPAERYQTVEDMQLELEELARELRLVISSVSLGRYVRGLFREQADAWAAAQKEGVSFPQFLATCDMPSPSTNTDTWIAPPSEEVMPVHANRDTPPPFQVPTMFPVDELRPARRRMWPLVAGVLALAGGLALWIGMRGGSSATADPTAAPPRTVPTAQVEIDAGTPTANVTPDAVEVMIDAAEVAVSPPDAAPTIATPPTKPAKPVKPTRPVKPANPKPPDNGLDDLLPH